MAPGKGNWWPWCRGARGDQKCCQRVLWEQKYQLVPNWGRFLAKLLFWPYFSCCCVCCCWTLLPSLSSLRSQAAVHC